MNDDPKIWHYGLMAERWAEFLHETPELEFLKQTIQRYGQPVLDLACGAGRLLLPLAQEGIDIDGSDFSVDMLDHCTRLAKEKGLKVDLYQSAMDAIDLPRRYRTIYIIGSFGLAGSRERDLEALKRCYAHLDAGGTLILNIQAEYTDPDVWNRWLPQYRSSLPEPWPEDGRPRIASDGSEHRGYFRTTKLDPLNQTYSREVRLEKWSSGELVAQEQYALDGQMYFKCEVELMLKVVGFQVIKVWGDFSQDAATDQHDEIVFTAVK
ncbi:MAG: class I SAM-dependent methyltransferase [Anaerolineales bacterium]|jgi:SAM-dependent methyltransferase